MAIKSRWFRMKPFREVAELIHRPAKYNVVHAGRRAYKTESRKRRMVRLALGSLKDERFQSMPFHGMIAAPTRLQVSDIYWNDIKDLIPKEILKISQVREVERRIILPWGAIIQLVGMDKPERSEGAEWDYIILDEYADMKADVLDQHIMPMLTQRMGFLDLVGVPEGRNHYYECYLRGIDPNEPDWKSWGWSSSRVQSEEWIRQQLSVMDDLTAAQELSGEFVSWTGRAYYAYDPAHNNDRCDYDPKLPLIFCFDFNVSPGVACVCQEKLRGTEVIGEVWIPRHSNTELVCHKLLDSYYKHKGEVICYGDASGGASGSAKVSGSDWDIVKRIFRRAWKNVKIKIPKSNPSVRRRVNAVNARLKSADGTRRLFIDPQKAPHVVRDLDGVAILEGTAGEIDKKSDKNLTHISDALGYYISYEFAIEKQKIVIDSGDLYIGGGQT